ncbi:hypothetical protein H0H92_000177 [Tricholoma furcatifolium]|nr:hypothetical protein H0H92_000177 [Tricholoma furcatifolium]
MPSKPSTRTRTWGTRFDTLPASPPISPEVGEAAGTVVTPANPSEASAVEPLFKKKEEKMPHDASVFVGSLPSNIDQQELTRLLSEHLSEHTEIKNIKVVRDSKGGVCAFVQCEDAASAASLINTLHSTAPKQFLGRTLRYEPARAFRTLLISYRTPMQHIPANTLEGKSQTIELNLPAAMRVWQPKNSKFYSLLYNGEAIEAENHARNDSTSASDKPSLFLHPLVFDAEAIGTIATYFGSLDSINRLQLTKNDDTQTASTDVNHDWKLYPSPHDAPRSVNMETDCWEIKWEHRDDCVSALMAWLIVEQTLRRVPHLTVTWSHQPPPLGSEQRSPYVPFHHTNFAQYPMHIQTQSPLARSHVASTHNAFGFTRNPIVRRPSRSSSEGCHIPSDIDSDVAYPEEASGDTSSSVRWSDMDFPPLGNARHLLRCGTGVWRERHPDSTDSGRSRSASLSLYQSHTGSHSASRSHHEDEAEQKDPGQELDMPPTPDLGRSPLTPKTLGFPSTPTTTSGFQHAFPSKEAGPKDSSYDFANREKDIDPTTLFVGGLETFGPGAWDEEKVAKFFARFGGLEEVKIVRPVNSHAAFAFVKFNNTEAPARAVFEEHNRVYEGRAMRVQLRECNPPRGAWRNNRGRGPSHFQPQRFGPLRRFQDDQDKISESTNSRSRKESQGQEQVAKATGETAIALTEPSETEPPLYTETANVLPKASEESTAENNDATAVASNEGHASSANAPFTSLTVQTTESYREWYDEPVSATPPQSASFSSSTSVPPSTPALPYPAPGGYYAPTSWVPYGQPVPFPVPYVGFPGYALPGQPPMPAQFQRPPGSEGNVPASPGLWTPIGMYGAPPARTPTTEAPQTQQPLNNRAPLAPTGFIQNDQGTLIAVYQPEALDQYMAGVQMAPAQPAVPQPTVQNIASWAPYSQPGTYTAAGPASRQVPSTNMAWIPNQGFVPQQQPQSTPHIPQTPHFNGSAGRGGYVDYGTHSGNSQFRRHSNRRDQGGPQNGQARNSQSQPRSFQNRNVARGNGNASMSSGYHGPSDAQSGARGPAHLSTTEWNQWGASGAR